jgi:hypothetical protein
MVLLLVEPVGLRNQSRLGSTPNRIVFSVAPTEAVVGHERLGGVGEGDQQNLCMRSAAKRFDSSGGDYRRVTQWQRTVD